MAVNMVGLLTMARSVSRTILRFSGDASGLAAVEFAFIVPVMLTLVFGTIEVASVVAIDRKVTLVTRTLSDLVSRGTNVSTSTDLPNFFGMGAAIMTPYPVTPAAMTQKLTAVNIDASKVAKVAWSYVGSATGSTVTVSAGYTVNSTVTTIPTALLVPNTQLIWSEVTYTYAPVLGYILKSDWPVSDQTYTRPRQSTCVTLNLAPCSP